MTSPSLSGTAPAPVPVPDIPLKRSIPVIVLAAITLAICLSGKDINQSSDSGVEMNLPLTMGDYLGYRQEVTAAEKQILPEDTEFARRTFESDHDKILCSIVLSGAERRSIHQPEACLPGQGWTINASTVDHVELKSGNSLEFRKLTLSREVEVARGDRRTIRSYYLYWFVGKDVTTPDHWKRILITSWDRIIHETNHRWAYVIVSSVITEGLERNGKNPEQTLAMLKDFIREIVPYFQKTEMKPATPQP